MTLTTRSLRGRWGQTLTTTTARPLRARRDRAVTTDELRGLAALAAGSFAVFGVPALAGLAVLLTH
jgi:hypothetical protein